MELAITDSDCCGLGWHLSNRVIPMSTGLETLVYTPRTLIDNSAFTANKATMQI